ncbi:MAG: RNA-dependent RNA polymerase [Fushun tombus-like virus 1]|nr:MAG: RNA-dependent RNA polymerase [Fushun tombus-like virus 1]
MTPIRVLLEGRTGRRRKRFYEGALQYVQFGVAYGDSKITEMQKLEFYEDGKLQGKEDRGIQFRSVCYNVALARYLHGVEERLIGTHYLGHHPVVKGLTPRERCQRLFKFASEFEDPVFLCADHSRFDAHVNVELLQEEHAVYKRCCPNTREFRQLLRWQLKNNGKSKGGIIYKMRGKRMSGDINTGLGNTVLNVCMLAAWLEFNGCKKYRLMVDGDDSVIILSRREYERFQVGIVEFMLKLGMETEMDVVYDIWKVDFCQSRPVLLPDGPTFVRNPFKVMTTMGRTAERRDDLTMQMVMSCSALSELAVAPGAPVTNELARKVLAYYGNGRYLKTAKQLYKEEAYGYDISDVDVDSVPEPDFLARYTFWLAWGIDPGLQEVYEGLDLDVFARKVPDKRQKSVREVEYDMPLEVDDLGHVQARCDCSECPSYDGEYVDRWLKI